jgi:hypothetical protein
MNNQRAGNQPSKQGPNLFKKEGWSSSEDKDLGALCAGLGPPVPLAPSKRESGER